MSDENKYAIIGMCAIVITLYALRNSEAHYLPDLFGLALALTAERPTWTVGAVCVLALIRHSRLAVAFAESVPNWLHWLVIPAARIMSLAERESMLLESAYKERIAAEERNKGNNETSRPEAENSAEIIVLAEIRALARLVVAGKLKKTEAIQIGTGKKSGPAYQERTRLLAEEIERQRNHYPPQSNLKRFD